MLLFCRLLTSFLLFKLEQTKALHPHSKRLTLSPFSLSLSSSPKASTLASQSHAVSTWPPHTQDGAATADRPHTISSAYEKGHQRPALTVYTFQNPEAISENNPKSPANISCRPPLPVVRNLGFGLGFSVYL